MKIKNIRSIVLASLIFFLFLLVTIYSYNLIQRSTNERSKLQIENQAANIASLIGNRVNRDIYLLYGIRGLYSASNSVERNEFRNFGDGFDIKRNFPGIHSIIFLQKVSADSKNFFIESIRQDTSVKAEGYPEFKIFPEVNSGDLFPEKYVYPEQENIGDLGFDFGTDPIEKAAMEKSLITDKAVITDRILPIGGGSPYYVVFLPIYKNGFSRETEADRRENLDGFAGVVIKTDKFFDSILQSEKINWKDFDLYIYDKFDGLRMDLNSLIYDADKESQDENKEDYALFKDLPLNFADKTWKLHFVAEENYGIDSLELAMSWIILIIGIILSFIISLFIYYLSTSQKRALILAENMTKDLRSSEERFRSITEAAKDAIVMMDEKSRIVLWNNAAQNMFGFLREEVLGKELHPLIAIKEEHKKKKDRLKNFGLTGQSDMLGKNVELSVKKKDGTSFLVELTISATRLNKKWYAVGIMRDITERKKAEEENKNKAEEMERINNIMVGRELKMIKLKKEIKKLKNEKNI